jgi:hypothetical protein
MMLMRNAAAPRRSNDRAPAHEGMRPANANRILAALAAAALLVAVMAPAHGSPTDSHPPAGPAAQWRSFDLYVELHDLPRGYTCTELWYRFHDVLMAIGARPWPRIDAYHCDRTPASSSRSPSVQLQFQLPDPLPQAQARYADVSVQRSTIRLGPGKPATFTAGDCELLKQMNDKLLVALPVHVVGSLSCQAGAAKRHFTLEVQALLPAHEDAKPSPGT